MKKTLIRIKIFGLNRVRRILLQAAEILLEGLPLPLPPSRPYLNHEETLWSRPKIKIPRERYRQILIDSSIASQTRIRCLAIGVSFTKIAYDVLLKLYRKVQRVVRNAQMVAGGLGPTSRLARTTRRVQILLGTGLLHQLHGHTNDLVALLCQQQGSY